MANELDLVARLVAWERGRAVPVATHRFLTVRDDALVVCPLAMAGNDLTVHALSIGPLNGESEIRSVPDPRFWSDQKELLYWFEERMGAHFDACTARGLHPQIWVASDAAAAHLDLLGDRLRFSKDERLRRLGERLAYATERLPVAGQQTLQVAAAVLRQQWATGQDAADDHHLGVLLTWIEPPTNAPLSEALDVAEAQPMGIKTDPDFDRDLLEPLVEQFREAIRHGDETVAAEARAAIHDALEGVVAGIATATRRAIGLVRERFPEAAAVEALVARENGAFAWWLGGREQGYPMPLRDGPRPGVFGLVTREDAAETHDAAQVHHDAVARARAVLAGDVLVGRVERLCERKEGRKAVCTFEVVTHQRVLRLRRRDEVAWMDDPRLRAVVLHVERDGDCTRVAMRVSAGIKAVGAPVEGSERSYGPPPPDWHLIARQRKQFGARLAVTPWTHDEAAMPAAEPVTRAAPADVLGAVEALR